MTAQGFVMWPKLKIWIFEESEVGCLWIGIEGSAERCSSGTSCIRFSLIQLTPEPIIILLFSLYGSWLAGEQSLESKSFSLKEIKSLVQQVFVEQMLIPSR
jgi:hypothetical protein